MRKESTRSISLLPLLLLACGGGAAAPPGEGFGWESPLNAYEPPTNAYQNPHRSGSSAPPEQSFDAGINLDSSTKLDVSIPDVSEFVDVKLPDAKLPDTGATDSSSGGCYAACAGTLTCTPQSGSSFDVDLALNGKDCDATESTGSGGTITLACGGTATLDTSTGTWTNVSGGFKICFGSGASTSCATCQ